MTSKDVETLVDDNPITIAIPTLSGDLLHVCLYGIPNNRATFNFMYHQKVHKARELM